MQPNTEARRERIRTALLAWYRTNARDLPWRRTRDPYAILVSEIMLQQTQVDRVLPYFERFLARFPTAQGATHASRGRGLLVRRSQQVRRWAAR